MESHQRLREEKEKADNQNQSQLTALGGNLATVRQQLEGERRKVEEREKRIHSQEMLIDGEGWREGERGRER